MRISSGPRKFTTTAVISISTALVLSSCSGNGETDSNGDDADDHRIPQEDIDRLNSSLAEANGLALELNQTASRLTRQCMEDEGYMHHPEPLDLESEWMIRALPGTEVPDQEMLPETDVAATEGVGLHEEWIYTMSDDYVNPEIVNDSEWLELGRDHHDEYFDALHEMEFVDMEDLDEEEREELFSDDHQPEFGGCRGWTVQQIYGSDAPDLGEVDIDEVDMDAIPPLPGDINPDPWEVDFDTPELLEAKEDWSSCLEERGTASTTVVSAVNPYVRSFYEDHPDPEVAWDQTQGGEDGFMERPEDAPWEFDEAKEQEIAYITDVAECADETDLRETRQAEWDQTLASMVIDYEEEMYTWEDQVRTALEEAQEALAG